MKPHTKTWRPFLRARISLLGFTFLSMLAKTGYCADNTPRLPAADMRVEAQRIGHTSQVVSFALASSGLPAASGDEGGNVKLWDMSSGRQIGSAIAEKGILDIQFIGRPGDSLLVMGQSGMQVFSASSAGLKERTVARRSNEPST